MTDERQFYKVTRREEDAPLRDHLLHGYEEREYFERAVRGLVRQWRDRVGEAVGERNGFLLLRFHDTPGGLPDEAWLPRYLLKSVPVPDYMKVREPTEEDRIKAELDEAFGFD